MIFWNWLTGLFDHGSGIADEWSPPYTEINPATCLPMVGGIDVAGNPYGTNRHDWQMHDVIHVHSSALSGLDNR